jgi:hypothetical protein
VEEVPPPDAAVLHAVDECLVLSGALVIHEAQEQAARIRAALAAGVHRFDLSALCKPGLALLGCPAHVREAARSLGLSEALEPLFREAA